MDYGKQDRDAVFDKRYQRMEFHVALTTAAPDAALVRDALFDLDPSAVVDLDMSGTVMRISASAKIDELVIVLHQAGWPVAAQDVAQLPSICCGGCGG